MSALAPNIVAIEHLQMSGTRACSMFIAPMLHGNALARRGSTAPARGITQIDQPSDGGTGLGAGCLR
jgi:hypothetical protein